MNVADGGRAVVHPEFAEVCGIPGAALVRAPQTFQSRGLADAGGQVPVTHVGHRAVVVELLGKVRPVQRSSRHAGRQSAEEHREARECVRRAVLITGRRRQHFELRLQRVHVQLRVLVERPEQPRFEVHLGRDGLRSETPRRWSNPRVPPRHPRPRDPTTDTSAHCRASIQVGGSRTPSNQCDAA